jgi:6-phosphogluconolactonase
VKGSLAANDPAWASVAPGSGPRHLAFHPSGAFAYVINEMLCTITCFRYDAERGTLDLLQTVSTLPDDQTVLPNYSTAEIEMHPTGRFLYGSNRGHNTLAVYSVNANTGRLTLVQSQSTEGKTPRGFGIDPSGKYLICGNQDSDNLASFRIDAATGRLSVIDQKLDVGSPVCVRFLPAK